MGVSGLLFYCSFFRMSETHLIPTYNRQPVAFTHGQGAWLWDEQDKRYLDALAGIAVCVLGHNHPRVTAAIQAQSERLLHTSNLYRIPLQEELGALLCKHAGMHAVFFGNSGAEANEAAIKLARLHGHKKGISHPKILVMDGAFHGRTLATLAATANTKAQAGFEPLPEGFIRIPFGDVKSVKEHAQNQDIAAILVEPIQGEGGVRIPPTGYLKALREICVQQNWLLMLDEVQTGVGRTGTWFAHQHEGITPDVMSLAKGLGGGVPIGACLVAGAASDLFGPGSHGSTFGGNPLACAAALAVLKTIEQDNLLATAQTLGTEILTQFEARLAPLPGVVSIRGRGLMLGIELDASSGPYAHLVDQARELGMLINVAAGNVIRLLPPLVLEHSQLDFLVTTLETLIRDSAGSNA